MKIEKRSYCDVCRYPRVTCVCDVLEKAGERKISPKSRITILQDIKESKSAKNTVRLIPLCFDSVDVFVSDSKGFFEKEKHILEKSRSDGWHIFLVYPNEKSTLMTDLIEGVNTSAFRKFDEKKQLNKIHLVFIDATWRRAYRLWKLNGWLSSIQSVHFENIKSQYSIRKAKHESYLSTIEAVVHGLNIIEPQLDTDIVIELFKKMQSYFLHYKNFE